MQREHRDMPGVKSEDPRPTPEQERRWLRYLGGYLDAAQVADMEAELDRDPGLRRRFEAWSETWDALRLPVHELETSVGPELLAILRSEDGAAERMTWSLAPPWARAAAAAALVSGLALGLGIELGLAANPETAPTFARTDVETMEEEFLPDLVESDFLSDRDSLAHAYWLAIEASAEGDREWIAEPTERQGS